MDRIAQALKLAKEENKTSQSKPVIERSETLVPIQQIEVPESFLRKQKVISSYWEEPIADAYRLLRTRVLQRMGQNQWSSLGVTSVEPQNGKSLTAINLGIAIAKEPNRSAIVVDADFRHPSTHQYFGIEPENGIDSYLLGDLNLEDILFSPGIEDFAILPCPRSIPGGPELLQSSKMYELVHRLKADYPNHTLIFDLPPVLLGDDVVAFSEFIDAMLLVIEDGETQEDGLKTAKELLSDINLIGTVLNKTEDIRGNYKDYYY